MDNKENNVKIMRGDVFCRAMTDDEYYNVYEWPNADGKLVKSFPDGLSDEDYKLDCQEKEIIRQVDPEHATKYKKAFLISTNVKDEKLWEIYVTDKIPKGITSAQEVYRGLQLGKSDLLGYVQRSPSYIVKFLMLTEVWALKRKVENSHWHEAPYEFVITSKEKQYLPIAFLPEQITELKDYPNYREEE